ncbi:hypothetical protein [Aeribacillus sp. FSL M8-0254]|uniref:hypothetical protein n=2 Tax=unclassified Aeribacillus TaxID=2640495 RepID=UPI0030FC58A1
MINKKIETINQKGNRNIAIQNSHITIYYYSKFDEFKRLAEKGDYNGAVQILAELHEEAGKMHPFYPHYRYKFENIGGRIVAEHEPLTEEAKEKYPLTYRGKFKIPKKRMKGFKDIHELIEDAFFKQDEIEIDMVTLNAWIGDEPVPTPNLGEFIKEGKWVIKPKQLPEPMKLKFYIKDEPEFSIIDYLEMGIRGIDRNNNILTLDNSRQKNSKLLVSITFPLINNKNENGLMSVHKAKINFKVRDEYINDVEANRDFLKFYIYTEGQQVTLAFKDLKSNKDFIVSSNFHIDNKGNHDDLRKKFSFLQHLYELEQFFGVRFTLPDKITKEDREGIRVLDSIKENTTIKKRFNNLTCTITEKETLKNIIDIYEQKNNKGLILKVTSSGEEARVELFGATIPLEKMEATYDNTKIDDLEKLKRKYADMEEGETIKVKLLPDTNNIVEEKYFVKK